MRVRYVSVKTAIVIAFTTLVVVLLAPGCSGSGGTPDSGTADVTAPNPCGNGDYAMCGTTCVDIQGDAQNCGACGKVCPSDQVCSHGTCAVVCGGGTARCANNC